MPAYARLRTAKRHRGPGKKKVWEGGPKQAEFMSDALSFGVAARRELRAAIFSIGTIEPLADGKKMGLRRTGRGASRHPRDEASLKRARE